ncbi:MAG TPA: methylated-DNA--[protein]-cysteine S-methyltransferase [Paracoccaceae bacterium]|nr:methylated-DNA--[protein]-cysteine S-methyltransferase [Paracoccaceae bacterium]
MAQIARLLDGEGKAPSLEEMGAATGLSPFQVQRLFTRATGMSPAAFARALREERAVRALESGGRITDAIYDAGYESAGRFYAAMRERLGMTPSAWRKGGAGVRIGYIIEPTTLGPMLLAATEKGVCRLAFHEGAEDLKARFPAAELVAGGVPSDLVAQVVQVIDAPCEADAIPLDTAGTPFQQRVWAQLRAIPRGETRSYAEIAAAIGQPKATRAVGGANGANPVAVLVPCHRVIAADGKLGGYAWGEAIKRELLRREGATPAWQSSP